MRVRRYFAADMREALRLVQEDLGPDAMVISNRRVSGGVEVVTALDYDDAMRAYEEEQRQKQTALRPAEERLLPDWIRNEFYSGESEGKVKASPHTPVDFPAGMDQQLAGLKRHLPANASADSELVAMRAELAALRELLKQQARQAPETKTEAVPQRDWLVQRLTQLGLKESVIERVMPEQLAALPLDKIWQQSLGALAKSLTLDTEKELVDRQGVVALLGPTGAGKTTTLAKLAARHVMRYGGEGLALLSTDCYRVGSFEQLQKIGRALSVEAKLVSGEGPLDDVIKSLGPRRLVLIDTAGFSRHAPEQAAQQQLLSRSRYRLNCQLVLPATVQGAVLERTCQDFRDFHVGGAILSKLDEASSLGEALSVLVQNQLPVTYVTNGQRIPEDIAVPRAAQLVSQAVAMVSHRLGRDAGTARQMARRAVQGRATGSVRTSVARRLAD